ncbi:MAG: urease accessory UreF family protein [Bauldia sp.]
MSRAERAEPNRAALSLGAFGATSPGMPPECALHLQAWLSPAFPTGSFAYSHGIEAATAEGRITDAEALQSWLQDLVEVGGLRCDAVLLAAAHRAASCGDRDGVREAGELALALPPSCERYLETASQGAAFLAAIRAGWPSLAGRVADLNGSDIAYPVAVGVTLALDGCALEAALAAYLNATASGLISAAMRSMRLGQSAGLILLAALQPAILAAAESAAASTLDDLASATVLSDIQSMRHERLYSRIFRS